MTGAVGLVYAFMFFRIKKAIYAAVGHFQVL